MQDQENRMGSIATLFLAGLMPLLCSPAFAQDGTKSLGPEGRVVRLPTDYSIGRAFIVEPQYDKRPLYHRALVWPNQMIPQVRGDVNVPSGMIFRFDVWDGGPRAHRALAALGKDDVQILNFYQCKKTDDRMLKAARGLTGLKVLFLGQGRFTVDGTKHLAGFRELAALQLPAGAATESLDYLRGLASLRYLNISGQELTDAKLAKVGQMSWLTQLSIAQLGQTRALRHVANLKSLRYLNLQAVRDEGLDKNLGHISDLTELEEIDFENSIIGDAGLVHLRKMKKLKELDLFSNPNTERITENGLAHLTHLTALEDVRLPHGALTDRALAHLAKLDSLKRLNLWSADLTDAGLTVLQQMKSLEDVDLSCPDITDDGLAALCRCTGLKSLSISRCKITDAGLANVANLESLGYFALAHVAIKGAGLVSLKHCPSLKEISLRSLELQGDVVAHAAVIPSLETLRSNYTGTMITDGSLKQLSKLTNLKTLSIVSKEASQMPITDAGIRHLAQLRNLEHIWLNHCEQITDEGLKHLEGLSSLRQLRLDNSRITLTAANRLKTAIPDVSVTVPATMQSAVRRPASPATGRTGRTNATNSRTRRRR